MHPVANPHAPTHASPEREQQQGKRKRPVLRILLIDNYDSFTYNIYQSLSKLNGGVPPLVLRNDVTWESVALSLRYMDGIVLGPGPGHPSVPSDFGVCARLLTEAKVPIFGICLGHQGMATVWGGKVVRARAPMHGRLSQVKHDGTGLFKDIPQNFSVVRYNSLLVCSKSLPSLLKTTAWAKDSSSSSGLKEIMGLKHREKSIFGVQFHPESVCTQYGEKIFANFLNMCPKRREEHQQPLSFAHQSLEIPKKISFTEVYPDQYTLSSKPREHVVGSQAKKYFSPLSSASVSEGERKKEGYKTETAGCLLTTEPLAKMRMEEDTARWTLHAEQLNSYAQTDRVFKKLFADCPVSFWLDSSKLDSACSDTKRGPRFSYMGSGGGKNSIMLKFDSAKRELELAEGNGKGDYAFVRRKTLKETKSDLFTEIDCLLKTRTPENISSPRFRDLPFPLDGGFVGYVGYEAKSESIINEGGKRKEEEKQEKGNAKAQRLGRAYSWRELLNSNNDDDDNNNRSSSSYNSNEDHVHPDNTASSGKIAESVTMPQMKFPGKPGPDMERDTMKEREGSAEPKSCSGGKSSSKCQEWATQPDACLFIADRIVVFDHWERKCYAVLLERDGGESSALAHARVQTNEEESAKTEGSLEPNTGRELNGLVDTGGRASLKSREGNIARCGTPWTKNSNAKRERADHKGKVQRARRNDEICGNISVSIFSEKAEKTRAESYDKYSPQPLSPSLFEMNSERWVAYVNSVLRQCQGSTDATQFEEKENPLQMKQENYSTKTQITSSQASTLPESSVKRDHKLLEKSGEAAHSPTMPETSRWGMNTYLGDVRWGEKAYKERIRRCQELIQDGESYELCLTNQMLLSDKSMELVKDPLDFYLSLRRTNPAPYGAFFSFRGKYFGEGHQNGVWNRKGCSVSHESQSPSCLGLSRGERKNGDGKSESREFCILSCSPERFLRITKAGEVESKPIKGTRPRGRNEKEDREIIQELKNSEKDFAENLMIVDLTRNDLGRVCVPGSISVPKLMHVETYATVHQLVSTIRGELGGQSTPLDALKAAFPPGSMTGAPKKRSTELLDVIEGGRRGIYSGCIGFIGFGGAVDLNVVIRTVVWSPERMTLGTGGAIIHVSDVEEEHIEMILKTRGIFMALRNFENEQKKSSLLGN